MPRSVHALPGRLRGGTLLPHADRCLRGGASRDSPRLSELRLTAAIDEALRRERRAVGVVGDELDVDAARFDMLGRDCEQASEA
jgi:hypothetical protein